MKPFHLELRLRSVVLIIAIGVLLPVMLSTAAGIVALVLAQDAGGIVTGVLVICFAAAAMGSALIAVVLTSRKARLARLQADFLASISHEFRTPLSAIRLYAQTLQAGKLAADPEQTARCVDTILRETEWLDVMVDEILTWRASSRDVIPLHMTTQPLAQAVNHAADRFRHMVGPDDIDYTVTVTTRLDVRHDTRALQMIVLNLLTNAYKYSGVQKRIELRAYDDAGNVLIEVRDNGVGLSPTEAKRIFQPFYRAESAQGSEKGGVGLGLAIARHLVERHGGTITVASEKGKGSTFTIRVPAAAPTP